MSVKGDFVVSGGSKLCSVVFLFFVLVLVNVICKVVCCGRTVLFWFLMIIVVFSWGDEWEVIDFKLYLVGLDVKLSIAVGLFSMVEFIIFTLVVIGWYFIERFCGGVGLFSMFVFEIRLVVFGWYLIERFCCGVGLFSMLVFEFKLVVIEWYLLERFCGGCGWMWIL